MDEILNKKIGDELRAVISNLDCDLEKNYDELFDKIYFIYVILKRYKSEAGELISSDGLDKLVFYFDLMLSKSIDMLKAELNKIKCKTLFEQSQIIFNYLGLSYLEFMEKGLELELSREQVQIIEASGGYSSIFDYMIRFWAKEMDLKIKMISPRPKNKIEETYLYTHFFLTESRYFNNEIDQDNTDDLLKNINYAIDRDLGDLAAELYWALSYFQYQDDILMNILRTYLTSKLRSNPQDVFSHYGEREKKHAKYSILCAFLEEKKKAGRIAI